MSKIALILLPLVMILGSCSYKSVSPKPVPCPVKDNEFCKQREDFLMKQSLFLDTLETYQNCTRGVYSDRVTQVCGNVPQWKDFKPN